MKIIKELEKDKDKVMSATRTIFDKHPSAKFIAIIAVLFLYFLFAANSHGVKDGLLISILSWSFFVFCTPVADAGVLLDFPLRLITGIKMIYSEIIVWTIAIGTNITVYIYNPGIYDSTILLSLFKHILEKPFPYWSIILLSALGTFLSLYIGDEILDEKKHGKHVTWLMKYKVHIFLFLIVLILAIYDFLLNKLGVNVPLL